MLIGRRRERWEAATPRLFTLRSRRPAQEKAAGVEALVCQSSDLNYTAAAAAAWKETQRFLNIYSAACLFRPSCEGGQDVSDQHPGPTPAQLQAYLEGRSGRPSAAGRPRPAGLELAETGPRWF